MSSRRPPPMFIGHSQATRAVHTQLRNALGSGAPVLVVGAPGTGKRVIAELLCRHTRRGDQLTELSIADIAKLDGLPSSAYLCPVEALDRDAQTRLLVNVGDSLMVLGTRLQPGTEAWYQRLHPGLVELCSHVRLPPLTARIDDLDVLVTQILLESSTEQPLAGISDEALICLRQHGWPGNVSELEAVIHEACATAGGSQIELWDLPAHLRLRDADSLDSGRGLNLSLTAAERDAIMRALRQARGNKRKAARLLGVGKTTLYRKLRLYGLS